MLLVVGGLAVAVALAALVRRVNVPRGAMGLAAVGLALLALAAGGMTWNRPAEHEVVVMVDLSPSTRAAEFRNLAALERRVQELLDDVPRRLLLFGESIISDEIALDTNAGLAGRAQWLADLPAERTLFSPPAAPAVLLFSDGRFEPPAYAPPTYIAIDPSLETVQDAAIERLEHVGDEVLATIRNTGPPRELHLTGTIDPSPIEVEAGRRTIARRVQLEATFVTARLSPGDLWPENDALSVPISPLMHLQRWWVSSQAAPDERWNALAPGELPHESHAWLAPAVVVLNNVPAGELSPVQRQRLMQYVRDLGGALVIVGGDRAFAAGEYVGSTLESLSPLASSSPSPTMHWMIVADSSGSMAIAADGASRWRHAEQALLSVLPHLPPDDLVSVGDFARDLRWWTVGQPAREAAKLRSAPAYVAPHGPTDLEPALQQLVAQLDAATPVQLLVLTDADVEIHEPELLITSMRRKNAHLYVLAIDDGPGAGLLQRIAEETGGSLTQELDPRRWTDAAAQMLRRIAPQHLNDVPLAVRFASDAAPLGALEASPWNRTWMKNEASPIAEAEFEGETLHPAARWRVGAGEVVAVSFAADARDVARLAELIEQPPRDARFAVTWQTGPQLRVSVDALDGGQFLNDLSFQLELAGDLHDVPQTGPGRYELSIAPPREPAIATLLHERPSIDRIAVAARYLPEFDAVGNDHAALRELARRSGGEVIPPDRREPIDFNWPPRPAPLRSWLACAGAMMLALSLLWWRLW